MLKHNVLLKITGSIAAYKSAYLTSKLVQNGYDVKVVMSEAAEKFIGVATFEALTGNHVYTDMFARQESLSHINLMKWADIIVVVPATANTINAFASGTGNNLITTLFLAHDFKKPYLIAPAMNTKMFLHPATVNAIKVLKQWGVTILDSDSGYLACGDEGIGKLLDPNIIFTEIKRHLTSKKNISILITSGGTKENIDNVRYITNMSTGNTGASIADYLISNGYSVTFLSAKNSIVPKGICERKEYTSFEELNNGLEELLLQNHYDIVIHLAAVGDYSASKIRVNNTLHTVPLKKKIKSSNDTMELILTKNFKIIDKIKSYSQNTNISLFGFKLVSGNSNDEINNSVTSLFNKANADFVVLNDFADRTNSVQNNFEIFEKDGKIAECKTISSLSEKIEHLINNKIRENKK